MGYKLYHDDGAEGPITTAVAFRSVGDPLEDVAEPYDFEKEVPLGPAFTGLTVRFILEALNSEGSTLSPSFLSVLVATVPEAPATAPVRLASTRNSLSVELPIATEDGGLTLIAYELVIDDGQGGEYHPFNDT